MFKEINDQLIQLRLTEIISAFLADNIPDAREIHLTPYVPERQKFQVNNPKDLKNCDLYCNLKVLIGNTTYFRQAGLFTTPVINSCSRIILAYRNRLAHLSPSDEVSLEQMLLEYISMNRLISLLPTKKEEQDLIEDTRSYIGGVLLYITKEYFNSEINRDVKKKLIFVDDVEKAITKPTDFDEEDLIDKITISECKQQLRRLRGRIQEENPGSSSWSNLLRESILEQIVSDKIVNKDMFEESLELREVKKTDESQFSYFPAVANILNKL